MDDHAPLRPLPLRPLHLELGARLVPFAGWEMPVHYPAGVMAEHLATRARACLFDVSHMGQVVLRPRGAMADLLAGLEALTPADLLSLPPGRQRYALLTTGQGGIRDDLMVSHKDDHLLLVVNASNAEGDVAHLSDRLGGQVEPVAGRALLALQGPGAQAALAPLLPGAAAMRFMDALTLDWRGAAVWASRSGYTGEDGWELSLPADAARPFAEALLARGVEPAGLGARDSLRLEAGLPLHGQDIDVTTSPVEAGLSFAVGRARRESRPGFPGAARILRELRDGPARLRVGLRPEGRAPMRAGTALLADGPAGAVTSGGFGPSVGAPVAMGYLPPALAAAGTALWGEVRGKPLPVVVAPLPFVPHAYRRGTP